MACQASRRNGRFCSAINCTNCDRKCPEMSFFKFPKDKDRYADIDILFVYMTLRENLLPKITSVSDNWFRFSLTFNFKEVLPWISDAGGNRPCVNTYLDLGL